MKRYIVATVVALLVTGGVAAAAVTFDRTSGTGFADRSDAQAALHLTDTKLERSASAIQFRLLTVTTAEIFWECGYFPSPDAGPTRFLDRSEAFKGTSSQRVSDSVARAGGAVTGFNLTGYSGEPTGTAKWSGPKPGSPGFGACPAGWELVTPPHASSGDRSFLQVSVNGERWADVLTLSP